jgi:hypothetical protein
LSTPRDLAARRDHRRDDAGVVSVPHGWGHGRSGVRLRVASEHAGASMNDINDPAFIDELSGTSALTGQPVEVAPA